MNDYTVDGPTPFDDCPAHGGIECEPPCPCICEECNNSDEDIIGSGEDVDG
jgi:hypothetical protein